MTDTQQKKNKIVLAFFGKSCSGKDSIVKYLSQTHPEGHKIISHTTRPMRNNEKADIDYHFIAENDFTHTDMLEYSKFRGWYYGTKENEIKDDIINYGIFNISAICQLKHVDWLTIIPIQITASDKMRLYRALLREDKVDCHEICRRFLADEEDYQDIPFEYFSIENDNIAVLPKQEIEALWAKLIKPQDLDFIL